MTTPTTTTMAPGTWTGDPAHSDVSFKVRHMGVGKARGSFQLQSAQLTIGDGGLADGTVTAVIDATSVDTRNDQRNEHIKSPEFLDVATYPTIEFRSTGVKDFDGETFTLTGDLTVHGTTKPIELATEFLGAGTDAYGMQRAGFSASTTLSRAEFGVDIQMGFGAGNAVVADKIEISLDIEFVLDQGEQGDQSAS
ncbi:YceI family protein [Nakamurella aerolata]|uniref:YceI family protein n=1 Tax=Nakamurella aerolata TaxID=1656892 RepID=A0A849ABZ1_9ACTN|nr:YceI family protein [Nakamurella aerolata]NNG36661.1 YceI family protein [Nakamurella aerolata]